MANAFDEFDAPRGNAFDEFDTPAKQDRSYLGASLEAGARSVAAAGARLIDELNPFTLSESDAAALYKDNPEKLQDLLKNHSALALSRFANEQTKRAREVMQQVNPQETGAVSGKPLGELEYATLDPQKAAYLSPTRVAGGVLNSLPTTAALAITGYLTRGRSVAAAAEAEAAALARGATQAEAQAAARQAAITTGAETMAKVGAGTEGAAGYAVQRNQTFDEASRLPQATVEQAPEYQALVEQGYSPEAARLRLASGVAQEAGLIAGAVDAGTNLVGGRFLGKAIGEGGKLLPRAGKGFLSEAATETVQSGGEQLGANLAMQAINPNQALLEGVGESMVAGGVVGGVTGGATAAVFGSRQRQAQAEQAMQAATDAGSAAAAANELAGSVDDLTSAVDAYLRSTPGVAPATGSIPTPQQAAASAGTSIPELRQRADREAELLATADAAGTDFERRMALEQLQAARPEAPERTAGNFADLTPMSQEQANLRLGVMRDELANQGGNSLELAVVPHPAQPGRFAIGKQALPSLELEAAPAQISPEEAQYRIESAALAGQIANRRAEDMPRQVVIDRALRNVEERGGVASPAEARIFQEAGLGQPYDRIDPNLAPALTTDETLTQATGIALAPTPRETGSESQRQAAVAQANAESMSEQERRNAANRAQAERETLQTIEQTSQPAAAPDANEVIAALKTPGVQRSAEQVSTIRQAQARYSASDFSVLERAAKGTFQLNAPERMRLDSLLKGSVVPAQQFTPETVTPATPPLMGTRVAERLGLPSNGRIVTSGAKFSTQRQPVPGASVTLRDGDTEHTVSVVDASKLGTQGRLLQQIARIFGKRLVAFQSSTLQADGFVLDDDNRSIFVNTSSQMSPLAVFGHELTHLLKRDNPQAYAALEAVVQRELSEGSLAKFAEEYGAGANVEELTSDLVGNRFQDAGFWSGVFNEIAAQNPEGARAIITRLAAAITKAVNDFLKVVRQPGFKADEYVKDLNAIKAAVKEALATYAQSQREEAVRVDNEPAAAQAPAAAASEPARATLRRRDADFTEPEQRQEVSTTRPVPAPKKGRTGTSYSEKWVIDGQDVRASQKHIDAVMKALRQYNTLSGKGNAKQLLQELHDVVVDNLVWLHDQVPANVRERAKLWYDGANRIATDWTSKYGVSLRQASGVLAVLSPQMDWFKNVSLGERVISIWKNRQNEVWTPAMTAWVESWVNASKDVDTKAARQAILDEVKPLQGVALSEMNDRQAALFIRAFDETYHERQYRLVTPEGGFGEYVTNSDDGDASVTWGGFDTIEKAVSVLNDGSFKNIDEQLGSEHKVRNFYNNIISPNSADGHVTIDTHAVAAALVKALSGSSREVMDNFGGAGQNAETGASGTYGLFADAYRDAAAKRGILPREMQSITWEAVRALFPASIKDQLAPKVDAVWNRFKKGEISRDQAREEVRQLAGGIRAMAWEGSDFGKFAAEGGTSFNPELDEDPAKRQARTLAPEVAKDKVSVSLSASTNSIPGIAELQAAAARGDAMAHELLQNIALDNLRHLLAGTSARVKANGATGLYGGYVESSLSATVSFADNDRPQVLAALAKFADNFNQEQVHVRRDVKAKPGTQFADGSYATAVYRWELNKALTRKQIETIIEKSGLYGLTFGDGFIEAYYVGDFNEEQFAAFERGIETAAGLVGKAAGSFGRSVERLWPYGQGAGTIGYDRIQGDVSAGSGVRSETAKRVADYLNAVKGKDGKLQPGKVKTFDQAAEITPEQNALQSRIAQVYESLPDNDLKNPNVRKAYQELAKEVIRQFKALPVKVEVMNGQGEPYANSTAMRRDILDNNHIFIFGTTPETFGPPGEDFTGHPLLEKTGLKDQNGYELLYNDLLRAVHDYYAHAMSPTQFGPKGEEAAWKNHMSMTNNMWARWALTAETRGQNSWVNFREGVQDLPITEREFARQKAVLLPVEFSLTGDRTVDKPMKEFIAKLGERVRQGTKPVPGAKFRRQTEGRDQAEREYLRVYEKYIGTPEWLKAPNGQPTNLTERQWIQVRTPSFKAWFGDWEKHARADNPVGSLWSDDNVSKVVDKNGEPLVVYHGTDTGGFSAFNESGGEARGDLGIFATPDRPMALTYVKRGRGQEITLPVPKSVNDLLDQGFTIDETDNDMFEVGDPDGYALGAYETRAEAEGFLMREYAREPIKGGDTSGYYASFMNIRNPLESDFEGAMWSGERPGQYVVLDENGDQVSTPDGKMYFDSAEEAERVMSSYGGEEIESAPDHYETTDAVVREARRSGNDGAIIRNVVDDGGGYSSYMGEPADVYIAASPDQVKSASFNTGEFGADTDDMRFSRRRNIFGQQVLSSWSNLADSKMDDAIYTMQDKQVDTKRVVEAIKAAAGRIDDQWNAYLQEELYHGRTAKQTADFLNDELRPLLQEMQMRGVTMEQLEEYLHNRHAEERNQQIAKVNPNMPDGGSGIDTADARAYLAGLTPAQRRDFDQLARRVDAITAGTRQLLVASGLETQDTVDAWEQTYGSYVPLFREDTDFAAGGGQGTGQGYSVRGAASRRATGSSRPVVDILANLAMQRERTIVRAQKARVAQAVYGMAVQNPNTDFWLAVDPEGQKDPAKAIADLVAMGINPIDAKNIIEEPVQTTIDPRTGLAIQRVNPLLRTSDNVLAVRVGGRERYVFFNANDERAQRMVSALKNLDADQLGRVMGMMAMVTRYFAAVNTQYNPIFGAINFMRDVQGATLNLTTTPIADKKSQVLADSMTALRGIYSDLRSRRAGKGPATGTWATLWEEFQREGGQTGFRDQFSKSAERAEALERELKKISEGKAKQAGRAIFDWLSDYNETMENAVRLAAYKAAKDKGLSNQQAASVAKNLTVNFNRKGQVATQAGALYAFFNASVQGTARLAETMTGPAGKKIMAGGLVLGVAQAMLLAAAGFDEDEPPDFVKERNLVIPLANGKYLTVPLPLGFNVIPNASRVLTEFALSGFREPSKRVAQIAGSLLEMFNPIGNAGWSVQTIAPTVADPLVALAENRDWTGKPIAKKDRSDLAPTPGHTRAKETASWIAKELSYYLNLASGGTKYKPGLISPTPDQIDYLIGQATGGVGRELLKVEQTLSSTVSGEELPTYKVPVLGRFYGDTKSGAAESERFYENLKRLNEHEAEIKGRAKNRENPSQYVRENPEARLVGMANQAERDVQKLRQLRRELVDKGAEATRVKLLEERIKMRMKQFNDRVKRAEASAQ